MTAKAQFDCVDGCGMIVSRKNGRCRTCAGLRRRQKKTASGGKKKASPTDGGVDGVTEALTAAGYRVVEASVVEATIQVRLAAPPKGSVKQNGPRKTDL